MIESFDAVLLSGGQGTRMGASSTIKTFWPLGDGTVIGQSIERFLSAAADVQIVVAVPEEQKTFYEEQLSQEFSDRLAQISVIAGGQTRQESSYNAIAFLAEREAARQKPVLIHDAARPFVRKQDIQGLLEAVSQCGAAQLAMPVRETVVWEKDGFVDTVLDRAHVYAVQTPQAFRLDLIWQAHQNARAEGRNTYTDDAQLILAEGKPVKVVPGFADNIKITYPVDYELAQKLIEQGI